MCTSSRRPLRRRYVLSYNFSSFLCMNANSPPPSGSVGPVGRRGGWWTSDILYLQLSQPRSSRGDVTSRARTQRWDVSPCSAPYHNVKGHEISPTPFTYMYTLGFNPPSYLRAQLSTYIFHRTGRTTPLGGCATIDN